MKKGGF